jgi:hypothetical protein
MPFVPSVAPGDVPAPEPLGVIFIISVLVLALKLHPVLHKNSCWAVVLVLVVVTVPLLLVVVTTDEVELVVTLPQLLRPSQDGRLSPALI